MDNKTCLLRLCFNDIDMPKPCMPIYSNAMYRTGGVNRFIMSGYGGVSWVGPGGQTILGKNNSLTNHK